MKIVKIGGVVATDEAKLNQLLRDLATFSGQDFVLVHGGGKEVTQWGERLGLQAQFREGIRLTTPPEMDVVDMVLGGRLNIDLVRKAQAAGLNAVGLGGQDGGLFTGVPRQFDGVADTRTGVITQTKTRLLEVLLQAGYFPIVHSTSTDAAGRGLNINADEAAQELAQAAHAEVLIYISDIDGVLDNGRVLAHLDKATLEAKIGSGVIQGGMIPKVRQAWQAVESGVGRVVIGGFRQSGDLKRLLSGAAGTTIAEREVSYAK